MLKTSRQREWDDSDEKERQGGVREKEETWTEVRQ